jgi:hypothetical protein
MMTVATMTRSEYGEIINLNTESNLLEQARELVSKAASKKRIPQAYDNMTWERVNSRIGNKRIGTAIHHEIYDIAPNGKAVLVCCREAEGTRYGIKTVKKDYYLIKKHGNGTIVEPAKKSVAAKAAKAGGNLLGYAIAVVTGKEQLRTKAQVKREGYKALTIDESGNLVSCWDGSEWPLGKTRVEKATDDHTGGFYYYRSMDEVLEAARANNIFGPAREHTNLMIVKVEVSGCEYQICASGKRCATRMKPVEVVAAAL